MFFFGLKRLELVKDQKQQFRFWTLYLGGGLVGTTALVAWRGTAYFGVGLPLGLIMGLALYLLIEFLANRQAPAPDPDKTWYGLTIIAILASVAGHFVEIQFGIATAATRTYFWAFAGLLLVVGHFLPEYEGKSKLQIVGTESPGELPPTVQPFMIEERRGWGSNWIKRGFVDGTLLGILLSTMGFDFLTASIGDTSSWEVVRRSMLPFWGRPAQVSGVPLIILSTWLLGGLLLNLYDRPWIEMRGRTKELIMVLVVSAVFAGLFWFWHAGGLIEIQTLAAKSVAQGLEEARLTESLITRFIVYLSMLLLLTAALLKIEWPEKSTRETIEDRSRLDLVGAPIGLLILVLLVKLLTIRPVQADISAKLGESYANSGQWVNAMAVFDRAIRLAPHQDFYYLLQASAALEQAKVLDDPVARDGWFLQAEHSIRKAQGISPLNSDHLSNLGRIYRIWAAHSPDPQLRRDRANRADEAYSTAIQFRPNDPRLLSERAELYLNVLQQPEQSLPLIRKAVEIDPEYDWSRALWGEYAMRQAALQAGQEEQRKYLQLAVTCYQQALKLARNSDLHSKYSYSLALAEAQALLMQPKAAITAYHQALSYLPGSYENWAIEEQLAALYSQIGQPDQALVHARRAFALAPDEYKPRLQSLIVEIEATS